MAKRQTKKKVVKKSKKSKSSPKGVSRRVLGKARNWVGWFEIYVQDMSRAKKFYEAVFCVKLQKLENPNHEMWAFPGSDKSYGAPGSLTHIPEVPSGQNSILVYFSCQDCAVEEKRVLENGGRVIRPKFPIGQYGFASLIQDTEGNLIGLHSM